MSGGIVRRWNHRMAFVRDCRDRIGDEEEQTVCPKAFLCGGGNQFSDCLEESFAIDRFGKCPGSA